MKFRFGRGLDLPQTIGQVLKKTKKKLTETKKNQILKKKKFEKPYQ